MKIMYRDLKQKNRSSRFRDIQKSAKSPNLEQVALRQVVRKRVCFRDRKNENTPKFPTIKILY